MVLWTQHMLVLPVEAAGYKQSSRENAVGQWGKGDARIF